MLAPPIELWTDLELCYSINRYCSTVTRDYFLQRLLATRGSHSLQRVCLGTWVISVSEPLHSTYISLSHTLSRETPLSAMASIELPLVSWAGLPASTILRFTYYMSQGVIWRDISQAGDELQASENIACMRVKCLAISHPVFTEKFKLWEIQLTKFSGRSLSSPASSSSTTPLALAIFTVAIHSVHAWDNNILIWAVISRVATPKYYSGDI
jgi:hypothetical protein